MNQLQEDVTQILRVTNLMMRNLGVCRRPQGQEVHRAFHGVYFTASECEEKIAFATTNQFETLIGDLNSSVSAGC